MHKRKQPSFETANMSQALESAVQAGALLKPMIEQEMHRITPEQRVFLKRSIIAAERILSDTSKPALERLHWVGREFDTHSHQGLPWQLVSARIKVFCAEPALVGSSEVGMIRFILGLILDALSSEDRRKAA